MWNDLLPNSFEIESCETKKRDGKFVRCAKPEYSMNEVDEFPRCRVAKSARLHPRTTRKVDFVPNVINMMMMCVYIVLMELSMFIASRSSS